MAKEPGYRLHKSSGQAYIRLDGRFFYLGKHGSTESLEQYNRLKAEWLLNKGAEKFKANGRKNCLADVFIAYLDFAESYYANSKEYRNLKLAIRPASIKVPEWHFTSLLGISQTASTKHDNAGYPQSDLGEHRLN